MGAIYFGRRAGSGQCDSGRKLILETFSTLPCVILIAVLETFKGDAEDKADSDGIHKDC